MDMRAFFRDEYLSYPRSVLVATRFFAGLFLLLLTTVSLYVYWSSFFRIYNALSASASAPLHAPWLFISSLLNLSSYSSVNDSFIILSFMMLLTVLIFVAVFVASAFVFFKKALLLIVQSFIQYLSIGVPEGTPQKYEDASQAIDWIKRRYEYRSRLSSQQAIAVFGYGIQYLSPAVSDIVATTVVRLLSVGKFLLRRAVKPIFMVFVLSIFMLFLPTWSLFINYTPALVRIIVNIGSNDVVFIVSWCCIYLLIIVFAGPILDWIFIRLLSSSVKPPAETVGDSISSQVSISPFLLSERFQEGVQRLYRPEGKTDRFYRSGGENSSASIRDMGNFGLAGMIEQTPVLSQNPNLGLGILRLWSGWALFFIGAFTLTALLLPWSTWNAVEFGQITQWRIFLDPLSIMMYGLAGRQAIRYAADMIQEGEAILETYWFTTLSLRYEIVGATSKSQVALGKAQDDSISTTSEVARTEFVARLTATNLLSEIKTVSAGRVLYGMRTNDECHTFIREVRDVIDDLTEFRPDLVAPNLSHDNAATLIKANATARAYKQATTSHALQQNIDKPVNPESHYLPPDR